VRRALGRGLLVWGLALAGLMLAACTPPLPPPAAKARPGALRPEYHQPPQWWQDNHMLLLRQSPAGMTLAGCRVCHQLSQACRPCHAYLGLPRGEADDD